MLRIVVVMSVMALQWFTGSAIPDVAAEDRMSEAHHRLIRQIEADVRATSAYLNKAVLDHRVMEIMAKVPRHLFVPAALRSLAYANRPLPIGEGQTISQPYIVAVMTDLLKVPSSGTVLEIGTGSGYQTAILAELCAHVYSIEIIDKLHKTATRRLERMGYSNVDTKLADGYYGWSEHGPYDAIIVTAAANQIPPPLVQQLKPGGRMVIPVGGAFMTQFLILVEKHFDETVTTRQLLPVRFVPLTGKH